MFNYACECKVSMHKNIYIFLVKKKPCHALIFKWLILLFKSYHKILPEFRGLCTGKFFLTKTFIFINNKGCQNVYTF